MKILSLRERRKAATWLSDGAALCITGPTLVGGDVEVQGSKNAAQKLVPITALVPGRYRFTNLPEISDTYAVLEIIEALGGLVSYEADTWVIDTRSLMNRAVTRDLTIKSTGTFQFVGALVGRFDRAVVAPPGGDKIGGRPVDLHLSALAALGVECQQRDDGCYVFERNGLCDGADLTLEIPSAGAFINALILACASTGPSTVRNAPWDSDIQAAADLLAAVGAKIERTIEGSQNVVAIEPILSRGATRDIAFKVPADRNDAATWLIAGALSDQGVNATGVDPDQVAPLLKALRAVGADVMVGGDSIRVRRSNSMHAPNAVVSAGPSPQLHSDWAQMLSVLLLTCAGASTLVDLMYESRYGQVPSLRRMGARCTLVSRTVDKGSLMYDRSATRAQAIEIHGGGPLRAADLEGGDVRGSMALLLAAAIATGTSHLSGAAQLARGYEHLASRLGGIGVKIEQCDDRD